MPGRLNDYRACLPIDLNGQLECPTNATTNAGHDASEVLFLEHLAVHKHAGRFSRSQRLLNITGLYKGRYGFLS